VLPEAQADARQLAVDRGIDPKASREANLGKRALYIQALAPCGGSKTRLGLQGRVSQRVTTRRIREIHHFIGRADRDDRKMRLDSRALESYLVTKGFEQGINR